MKQNITLSVDAEMYLKFKTECVRNRIKFGQKLESFMCGYSNNHKIQDFISFEEISNPRIDINLDEMNDLILGMETRRAVELLYKVEEWKTRLLKK